MMETDKRQFVDKVTVRNVLVSVSDKAGLASLVQDLTAGPFAMTLYATGGTYRELDGLLKGEAGQLQLRAIEDYTRYPEMPGGLVKTLHPRIHGGLLADLHDENQVDHLREQGMIPFDLVIVNLYPFERTVAHPEATLAEARKQIDIGGPTMLRAAAKNFPRVAVVVDPADYGVIIRELNDNDGALGFDTRWRLAQKAFRHVLAYDEAISIYFDELSPQQARQALDAR